MKTAGTLQDFWDLARSPRSWPRHLRLMLVLGFPIAVPIWLLMLVGLAFLKAFHDTIFGPLYRFCVAPRRRSVNYYTYGDQKNRSRQLGHLLRPAMHIVANERDEAA